MVKCLAFRKPEETEDEEEDAARMRRRLDSRSSFRSEREELKMEEVRMAARLFLRLLSNLGWNLTFAKAEESSSDLGRRRMPRPIFLEVSSS